MSEVDRLSNSGLYPALPIGDRRTAKDNKERQQGADQAPNSPDGKSADAANTPRPPKSQIDEYA
jgi:hypothetical protein